MMSFRYEIFGEENGNVNTFWQPNCFVGKNEIEN